LTAAGAYVAAMRTARTGIILQRIEEDKLDASNAQLKENEARITIAKAILDRIAIASPVKRQFLEALNRARPAQVSIRTVTLNESTWTVTGTVHEGGGLENGPYQSFLASFAKYEGWTIGKNVILHEHDFTLNGTIP
jgi:hypothetical protein